MKPKILISGSYNAFDEGWNGAGVYMCSGLYQSETYKIPAYIGSAEDLQERIEKEHIVTLDKGNHPHNSPLQYSWNKHNEKEGFVWWLLELYKEDGEFLTLKDLEQKWLDSERPFVDEFGGFNIAHDATAPMRGRKTSDETKRKISKALKGKNTWAKGRKCGPHSEETRRKIGNAQRGRRGISEETRRKLSESHKGKIPWNKGRKTPCI